MLQTPRLLLLPLSRALIERRLQEEAFEHVLATPDGPLPVTFTAQWPGDPLPLFPAKLERLIGAGLAEAPGSFVAVTRADGRAVGQLGGKGGVDAHGAVEIGYGFAPADWGQGYATEAVRALTAHFLQEPGVRTVTAQTAVANPASRRVLEKCGFRQTGTAWDEEDGDLLTWAVTPTTLTNGYSIE